MQDNKRYINKRACYLNKLDYTPFENYVSGEKNCKVQDRDKSETSTHNIFGTKGAQRILQEIFASRS